MKVEENVGISRPLASFILKMFQLNEVKAYSNMSFCLQFDHFPK